MIRIQPHKQTDPAKKPGQVVSPVEPTKMPQAPTPLADYIQRVQEAEKGLPEPTVVVSKPVIERVVRALWWSNPYLAGVLQEELDKAQQ